MKKQQGMTETASIIYRFLNTKKWKSVGEMANLMRISEGCCQLILTQLVMAGLAIEDSSGEQFRRSYSLADNRWLGRIPPPSLAHQSPTLMCTAWYRTYLKGP